MPGIETVLPIVDCDTHVTEPPDLWTSRLSKKQWGDDIPQLQFDETSGELCWRVGNRLLMGEAKFSMAGWREYPPAHPPTLDDADLACWDPHERLKRMDEYGIYAQVLYPNVIAFWTKNFLDVSDPRLPIECVSAYNDFLIEWTSVDPKRLVPIMMLPFWDLEASERELHRAAALGHKGVLMAAHYEKIGLPQIWDPHWDRLLSAIQDHGLSINFHVGFARNDEESLVPWSTVLGPEHTRNTSISMLGNSRAIADVICTGLCHRFPDLKFVSVESGAGWLLYLLESLDWHWKNYGAHLERPEMELPSYYFRRQIFGSFWFEGESVRAVAENLADNIMFETDFPHPTSLSPGPASAAERPRDMAERAVTGLPDDVITKILYKNAADLYGLDLSVLPVPVGS